jgi:hypothetical protein
MSQHGFRRHAAVDRLRGCPRLHDHALAAAATIARTHHEQRRALQLLAEAPNGHTEAALRARGFTPTLLVELAARGYTVARPETMKAAGKTFGFMRFVITDSGRTAIG